MDYIFILINTRQTKDYNEAKKYYRTFYQKQYSLVFSWKKKHVLFFFLNMFFFF